MGNFDLALKAALMPTLLEPPIAGFILVALRP
jgi:hypothetical protein